MRKKWKIILRFVLASLSKGFSQRIHMLQLYLKLEILSFPAWSIRRSGGMTQTFISKRSESLITIPWPDHCLYNGPHSVITRNSFSEVPGSKQLFHGIIVSIHHSCSLYLSSIISSNIMTAFCTFRATYMRNPKRPNSSHSFKAEVPCCPCGNQMPKPAEPKLWVGEAKTPQVSHSEWWQRGLDPGILAFGGHNAIQRPLIQEESIPTLQDEIGH